MRDEILRIENVIYEVDGITYLDNIQLNVFKGEILGLIPLDHHGKTHLVDLILQNIPINFGRVYFADGLVNCYEHSSMTKNAAYLIEKETKLVRDLKVVDNVWTLSSSFRKFIIRDGRLLAETSELLANLGLEVDPDQYVSELGFLETVTIELMRAVTTGAKLIILNELASFLSMEELRCIQKLLLDYAREGVSFLYIASHHEEMLEICQRIALFERGRIIKVILGAVYSEEALHPYFLRHPEQTVTEWEAKPQGIFQCFELYGESLSGLGFSVHKGECLTILDPSNRGIGELAAIVNGHVQPLRGKLFLAGEALPLPCKQSPLLKGLAYIPENPAQDSLFYNSSYLENLTFLLDRKLRRSIIPPRALRYIKQEFKALAGAEIEAPDLWGLEMRSLYNLVYFRLLLYNPKVVFIMQPFAHADMYLRARIIELINMLKQRGVGVVILAVNLSDTLSVTDRLLVLEAGQLVNRSTRNF